jgi:hypothetical protein
MPRVDPRHRQFCEALLEESAGAARLGLPWEEAAVLADDCEKVGLVRHNQSQHTKAARLATAG